MSKRIFRFDFNWIMSEAVENSEVLTGDISTATERDSVDRQETTGTGSADGIRRIVANKAGFNQLSSKITRFEAVAKDPQNVFELPEELLNYANKYIGVFCLIKIWRAVFWPTTQYPQISINPQKLMISSKSYWEKKEKVSAKSVWDNVKGPTESL